MPRTYRMHHPTLPLLLLSCRTFTSVQTCYYPNGRAAGDELTTCSSTSASQHSACCDPEDACTSSGICTGRDGYYYRGGCTDSTWASGNCAVVCQDDYTSAASKLYPCPVANGTWASQWCCGASSSGSDSCCSKTITGPVLKFGLLPEMAQAAMAANLTSTSTASATSSTVQSTSASTTTTATSSPASNTSNTTQTAPTVEKATDNGAIIGVSVALSICIALLLAIIAFLLYRLRRQPTPKAEPTPPISEEPKAVPADRSHSLPAPAYVDYHQQPTWPQSQMRSADQRVQELPYQNEVHEVYDNQTGSFFSQSKAGLGEPVSAVTRSSSYGDRESLARGSLQAQQMMGELPEEGRGS